MRLLFDQNLPPRLVSALGLAYPGSTHVAHVGLERAMDHVVSEYASREGFVVVTKDADFADLAQVTGSPLRVVWLRIGNCTTTEIELLLRERRPAILRLDEDPALRVVALG